MDRWTIFYLWMATAIAAVTVAYMLVRIISIINK